MMSGACSMSARKYSALPGRVSSGSRRSDAPRSESVIWFSADPRRANSRGPVVGARAARSPPAMASAADSSDDNALRMERAIKAEAASPVTAPPAPDMTRSQKARSEPCSRTSQADPTTTATRMIISRPKPTMIRPVTEESTGRRGHQVIPVGRITFRFQEG